MGWTFQYDIPRDKKAEITGMLTWETEEYTVAPLKVSNYGSTYYAAVKMTPKLLSLSPAMISNYTPNPEDGSIVFAAVYLTKTSNGEWGYKDMSEDTGPYHYSCPAGILDLLSPVKEGTYASEWREKCRVFHKRLKPKTGDVVRLEKPWDPYGQKFEKLKLRAIYKSLKTGSLVRLYSRDLVGATLL